MDKGSNTIDESKIGLRVVWECGEGHKWEERTIFCPICGSLAYSCTETYKRKIKYGLDKQV